MKCTISRGDCDLCPPFSHSCASLTRSGLAMRCLFSFHEPLSQENLYTKEEMKVTWETRKILDVPDMAVRLVTT